MKIILGVYAENTQTNWESNELMFLQYWKRILFAL